MHDHLGCTTVHGLAICVHIATMATCDQHDDIDYLHCRSYGIQQQLQIYVAEQVSQVIHLYQNDTCMPIYLP